MAHLEFFFDLSSPWTRLAFHNVRPILSETGATVTWRPFLVGGVFNVVNPSVYAGRENPTAPKNRHTGHWLRDWARLAGVPMNFPSAEAAFDAYFAHQRNLDDPAVLADIATACGHDGPALIAQSQTDDIKARLRANTQEVIDRGGFGSPTMFVDKTHIYFGNDQLPLVRQALSAPQAPESSAKPAKIAKDA